MRGVPTEADRRARRAPGWSVAVALLLLVGLLGACGSSSDAAGPGDLLAATSTTIDPGPGPTSFDAAIRLDPVVSGLDDPIAVVARPMRNQLWVAERAGRVRVVTRVTAWDIPTGKVRREGYRLESDPVLDISQLTTTDGTRGLLSLAFSTDGQTLYLHHTGTDGELIVARYSVTDPLDSSDPTDDGSAPGTGPDGAQSTTSTRVTSERASSPPTTMPARISRPTIDPGSRMVLLDIEHERALQHYGGHLALGPDGYLYISTGGTGKGIPLRSGQDPDSLHGKILRIDPSVAEGDRPYSIPEDNPFAHGGGSPEVSVLGVRNPWRFSFDRATGAMWIGDVGQDQLEEIDVIARDAAQGANLGWPVREGDLPFARGSDEGITAFSELTDPILVYPHSEDRCAVIGGYVYRGSAVRALDGVYLYADHCTGELRGLLSRRGVVLADRRLDASIEPSTLNGFGQDDDGEVYVLTTTGTLSVIASAT